MPTRRRRRAKQPPVTHTITIQCSNAKPPVWTYDINPKQRSAKKAKIRRGDTVQWYCNDGDWKVFFKDLTPLVTDPGGVGIAVVHGKSGPPPVGGLVSKVTDPFDSFEYGVTVVRDFDGKTFTDDPEIIIES